MLRGKFKRGDIETPKQVLDRVINGFSDFKDNSSNLLFAHSGIIQCILFHLDIHDLFIKNCGSLNIVVSETGLPLRLVSYWNHGY